MSLSRWACFPWAVAVRGAAVGRDPGRHGLGFFLGGLRLWFTALHHRRAARRAEDAVRLLEARHQELQARPHPAADAFRAWHARRDEHDRG